MHIVAPLLLLALFFLSITEAGLPFCYRSATVPLTDVPSQPFLLEIQNSAGIDIYYAAGAEWHLEIIASSQSRADEIVSWITANTQLGIAPDGAATQTLLINVAGTSSNTNAARSLVAPSAVLALSLVALHSRSAPFAAFACAALIGASLVPAAHAQSTECLNGAIVVTYPAGAVLTPVQTSALGQPSSTSAPAFLVVPSATATTAPPTLPPATAPPDTTTPTPTASPSPTTATPTDPPTAPASTTHAPTHSPAPTTRAPSTAPPATTTTTPPPTTTHTPTTTTPAPTTVRPTTAPPATTTTAPPAPITTAPPATTHAATPSLSTTGPGSTTISTTDGSVQDWSTAPGVHAFPLNSASAGIGVNSSGQAAPIAPAANIVQGWAWANASVRCWRLRHAAATNLTACEYSLFIDADANAATGYLASGGAVGAEYMLYQQTIYAYTGPDASAVWSWSPLAAGLSSVQYVGSDWEACAALPIGSQQTTHLFFQSAYVPIAGSWVSNVWDWYPAVGSWFAFAACDSIGAGNNPSCLTPPSVTALAVSPDQPISPATVSVTVSSPYNNTVSISLQVSLDNGVTWRSMRVGSSLGAVVAAPAGSSYTVGWDATNDLGIRSTSALVRAFATDINGPGAALTTASLVVPQHQIVEAFVRRVDHHAIHYGDLNAGNMAMAQAHQVVTIHASHITGVSRALVSQLQQGLDPADPADDPLVLCYISIGEDLRTATVSNATFFTDPRFRCDGTGPRVDPRGPAASGGSLLNIDPLGVPSPGGTGWCSYYMDDNSVIDNTVADLGIPDRNKIFGGAFTNAGDPMWFSTLKGMLFDSPDGQFGIDELLQTGYGRGLGCDGLFLDTVDTAAPNSYTDSTSPNESKFEWTAAGFRLFMQRLRAAYPDVVILQNRGIFFFSPVLPQFQVTTRGLVDFVLYESFRLNSNSFQTYDPVFYPDNRYNYAPKLMAEANRPDGFRVLSLGYAEGPNISHDTLLGQSTLGYADLLEDLTVTEEEVGFRHYITTAGVDLLNEFCLVHSNTSLPASFDVDPPFWTSTYNPNSWPPAAPPPRVGIQLAVSHAGYVEVQWDVALDLNRVHYALYFQVAPFDFSQPNPLAAATRVVMVPGQPANYVASATTYPYAYNVTAGLQLDTEYFFLVRAFDESPNANEEQNQVTLSAYAVSADPSAWSYAKPQPVPATAGPVWELLNVSHSAAALLLHFKSWAPFNLDGSPTYGFPRINFFLDLDDNPSTGYQVAGIGSEVLVQGTTVVAQASGVFNSGYLGAAAAAPTTAITDCVVSVPIALLRTAVPGAARLRVVGQNDDIDSWIPPSGVYLADTLP